MFDEIYKDLTKLDIDHFLEYFKAHNYLLNKRVKTVINGESFYGEVVEIDYNFNLQVRVNDMLLHIDSGEIEIL